MQEGLEALQRMMGDGSANVEVADSYTFSSAVVIHLTSTDNNNKKTEMDMRMLFPEEDSYYGIELIDFNGSKGKTPQAFMIFDYLNYKMISLMEESGQKMGFAMDLNMQQIEEWEEAEVNEELEDLSFTKTGKTKNILGYSCEHYLIETAEGKGDYWVSSDDDLKIGIALNSMAKSSKGQGFQMPADYPEGAILEMSFVDNNGNSVNWLATSIEKNKSTTIKTGDYTFLSIGQ